MVIAVWNVKLCVCVWGGCTWEVGQRKPVDTSYSGRLGQPGDLRMDLTGCQVV